MSKALLAELRWKRKVYGMWKGRQATWEEYRNVVRACREATRKVKVHLKLEVLQRMSKTTRSASSSTSAQTED